MEIDKRIVKKMKNVVDELSFELSADSIYLPELSDDIFWLSKRLEEILRSEKTEA